MVLTKPERGFIALLAIVLIFSIYYVYFYIPLQKQIDAMSAEIKTGETTLELKKTRDKEIELLKEELQMLMERTTELRNSLPPSDEPGLLIHLYHITTPLGTREYIEFGDAEIQTEFIVLPVYISVKTDYARLKEMLRLLENSSYRNRIEDLSVQMSDGGNSIYVNMALNFFFKPEPGSQNIRYPSFMDGGFGKDNPFEVPAVEN